MHTSTKTVETNPGIKDFNEINLTREDNFLFITNNFSEIPDYHYYFTNSIVVNTLIEAKDNLQAPFSPNLIIIDIPLDLQELNLFKKWLTSNHLSCVPLIYNESALEKEQINQLFTKRLVDDVVHLEKDYKKLKKKAKFLAEVRMQAHSQPDGNDGKDEFKNKRSLATLFLDVFFSLIIIICLIPIFLLIALAIRLESKGPVFYRSPRAGMGYRIFNFYKFRTMVVDADKQIDELEELNIYSSGSKKANFFKIKNDPRITKVGAFLRNTSLDELPQLFNVLKGDMSLVGNRPLPIYEASTLTTNEWAERFMAPAGITGLWQISKRGRPEMSIEERIFLDINYARNRSVIGDLKILIKTPSALKQKANV